MKNLDDVEFVDIHRLLQHPINNHGKTFHRPITVKPLTTRGKNLIFKKQKNLKAHNIDKKQGCDYNPFVYVSEYLPGKFQEQRKLLLNEYKKARKNKKKATWKAVDGNYTLFVNGKQIYYPRIP